MWTQHFALDINFFCSASQRNPNFVKDGNSDEYLPPATKLGQGNIFTGVCDSVHGGGLPQCMLEYPPGKETPLTRQTPSSPLARRPPQAKADPPPAVHAGRYVGGMHPTRMHFLFCTFLLLEDISVLCNSVLDLGDVFPRLQSMRRSLASLSRACNGLPQIHLWCDNCRPFSGQHGSRTLYPLIFSNRSGNPWFQVLAQLLHLWSSGTQTS